MTGGDVTRTALSYGIGTGIGHVMGQGAEDVFGSDTDTSKDRQLYGDLGKLGMGIGSLFLNVDTSNAIHGASTVIDHNFLAHIPRVAMAVGGLGVGQIVPDDVEDHLHFMHEVERDTAQTMQNDERWYVRWAYYMGTAMGQVDETRPSDGYRMLYHYKQSSNATRHVITETPSLLWDYISNTTIDDHRLNTYGQQLGLAIGAMSQSVLTYQWLGGVGQPNFNPNYQRIYYKDGHLEGLNSNRRIHKNNLDYYGDTHVYQIMKDNIAQKIGESAKGLNQFGQSKRGETQVRKLNKQSDREGYESKILGHFKNKREARAFETELIKDMRSKDPNALPLNKNNR